MSGLCFPNDQGLCLSLINYAYQKLTYQESDFWIKAKVGMWHGYLSEKYLQSCWYPTTEPMKVSIEYYMDEQPKDTYTMKF